MVHLIYFFQWNFVSSWIYSTPTAVAIQSTATSKGQITVVKVRNKGGKRLLMGRTFSQSHHSDLQSLDLCCVRDYKFHSLQCWLGDLLDQHNSLKTTTDGWKFASIDVSLGVMPLCHMLCYRLWLLQQTTAYSIEHRADDIVFVTYFTSQPL